MNRLNQNGTLLDLQFLFTYPKLDYILLVSYDPPLVGGSLKVGTLINGHKTCKNVTALKSPSTNSNTNSITT